MAPNSQPMALAASGAAGCVCEFNDRIFQAGFDKGAAHPFYRFAFQEAH